MQMLPLCVDLDGTLVKTDTLIESFWVLCKKKPIVLLWLPAWLLRGKAYFKQQIARQVTLDVTRLPYHSAFVAFLSDEARRGRSLVLATAADSSIAQAIADHLGLFSEVLASDGSTNLSGHRKRSALQERFGHRGFDYAGNATVDLEIWAHAHEAILVNPAYGLVEKARKVVRITSVFEDRTSLLRQILQTLWSQR